MKQERGSTYHNATIIQKTIYTLVIFHHKHTIDPLSLTRNASHNTEANKPSLRYTFFTHVCCTITLHFQKQAEIQTQMPFLSLPQIPSSIALPSRNPPELLTASMAPIPALKHVLPLPGSLPSSCHLCSLKNKLKPLFGANATIL